VDCFWHKKLHSRNDNNYVHGTFKWRNLREAQVIHTNKAVTEFGDVAYLSLVKFC
jgi:hypothetical protein